MKVDVLFYGSGVLTALSFLLFAYQVWIYVQRMTPRAVPPPAAPGGLGGVEQQTLTAIQGVQQTVQQVTRLAEGLSKAGPMATSAVLCILFALICLLSSGVIKVAI